MFRKGDPSNLGFGLGWMSTEGHPEELKNSERWGSGTLEVAVEQEQTLPLRLEVLR